MKSILVAATLAASSAQANHFDVEVQGKTRIVEGQILIEAIEGNRVCLDVGGPMRSCMIFQDGEIWAESVIADMFTIEDAGYNVRIFDVNDKKAFQKGREPRDRDNRSRGKQPRTKPDRDKPQQPGPIIGVGDINIGIDVNIGNGGSESCTRCHSPDHHEKP